MSPSGLRILGIVLVLGAAFFMVINLKRVADARTFWVAIPLLLVGLIIIARSRRRV
jgi:hypothetical protein